MATAKLEICFDSGQFVGGAKNLQDQCVVVIYLPKKFVNRINFALEFWSNAAKCSEIYAYFLNKK